MSIIPRLLAGNADEAVDLNAVRAFLGGGTKKSKKQVARFARKAKESELGGDAGFEEMSAYQQRKFVEESNDIVSRRLKSDERVRNYSGPRQADTYPSLQPTTIPQLLLGSAAKIPSKIGETIQQGAASASQKIDDVTAPMAYKAQELVGDAGKAAENISNYVSGTVSGAKQRVKDTANDVGAYVGGKASKATDTAKAAGEAVVNRAGEIAGDAVGATFRGAETVTKAATAVTDAVSENAPKVFNAIAGDTSGTASAAAGRTFQESYESVFSSKETAEAFGVDSDVLKTAFGQSGDDFKATLQGAGASDDIIEGLDAFRNQVKLVQDEGGQLSEEGMQAMLRNQGELGNMYGGFSRASASASPNAVLRGLGGEGSRGDAILGIMGAAALAGGANTMMGGDFFEGAAVGGGAAFGMRALAKGVAGSMGDIEQSMVKSILGDDMTSAGTRLGKTVDGSYSPGTELSSIPKGSGLTLDDLGIGRGTSQADLMLDDFTADVMSNVGNPTKLKAKAGGSYSNTPEVTETVSGAQARRENLEAIQNMASDDERLKGFGKKRMQKLLDPTKSKNTAVNNRALVLGGSMLSGVAFTGSADKRDYRRGFNAHRGNRI